MLKINFHWVPFIGVTTAFVTIIAVYLWAGFLGHLPKPVPYISETGGKDPEHMLFAAGMLVSAFCQTLTVLVFAKRMLPASRDEHSPFRSKWDCFWLTASMYIGAPVIFLGLAGLGMIDTYNYLILHTSCAQAYFIAAAIVAGVFMQVITHHGKYSQQIGSNEDFKCLRMFKLITIILLWVFAIPYLGLLALPFMEKTNFTDGICAILQYLSIFMILLFFGSFSWDLKDCVVVFTDNGYDYNAHDQYLYSRMASIQTTRAGLYATDATGLRVAIDTPASANDDPDPDR